METGEKIQVAEHMARAWSGAGRVDATRLLPGEKAPRIITREPRDWFFSSWDPNLAALCAAVGGFVVPIPFLLIGLLSWLGALGALGSVFEDRSAAIAMFFTLLSSGAVPLLIGAALLSLGIFAFQRTSSLREIETASDEARMGATIVALIGLVVGGAVVVFTGIFLIALLAVLAGALSDSK